jgi:PucR family transcriptional regulator, purine catabolism regulatory protein
MSLTCEEMMRLPYLEKIKVVAGEVGLNKVISWVHVVEIPEVTEWVKGGELLFITGVTIQNNKEALLQLVRSISKKSLSGLVINVGPYIKETPQEVIDLANLINFPIFELPFEVKLIEVTQSICSAIFTTKLEEDSMNSFMKEIILGSISISEETLNRAMLYGYNIKKSYYSLVVDIDDFRNYIKNNGIEDEKKIWEIKITIRHIIDSIMFKYNKKHLLMVESDSFYIMVPVGNIARITSDITTITEEIKDDISERIKGLTVSVGIGGVCSELKDFKIASFMAQKALEILKREGKTSYISDYKELGIYRLFFDMSKFDEMKNLFNETLLKLQEYDEKSSSNLFETLSLYFNENRNLGQAAEKMYIHRNTMKYRIKRIQEILNCDLKDEKTVFNITLCLKIGKFLNLT